MSPAVGSRKHFKVAETAFGKTDSFPKPGQERLKVVVGFRLHGRRNRQELINAVGIVWIPGLEGEQTFSHESITCIAKLMKVKRRHGTLHDVQPPTGQSLLVGGEGKEQIESELPRLEIEQKLP